MIPVFDGHNDFLQRLLADRPDPLAIWRDGDGSGHIDLPRLRRGGVFGGFFALWAPSPPDPSGTDWHARQETPPYAVPLDQPIDPDAATAHMLRLAARLVAMERDGALSICCSVDEIIAAKQAGRIAAILHMEGAEGVADPDMLHLWHRIGLRSLGPVWSRINAYGHGVPFAFPADPDRGPGLTDAGKRLIEECDRLRILVDLAHLNARGVEDVARISGAPLVSTHSGAHAVSASTRNLTDAQLRLIADSRGVVGLNFAAGFVRPDGCRLRFDGFDPYLRHLDHMIEILGENGVALGSDFDGALMPNDLQDAAALPNLLEAMRAHGYGAELIEKIAWRNWIDVLRRTWER
ncbi:membrane dipeptidase [Paracoccus isoporae]|uniref:Membrane dipeptidase n=1 Tax=Paracoccus isoporae TaxID=591205 RepID=A0A1G6W9N4_9RHOB|nr:dipeptidase [Paracoccus isoporae]SDD62529.1 membrane dipeptidase [Paracoccus isoporae]